IDELLETSQYVEYPGADTSKPGANRAESDSKGERKVEFDSRSTELAKTDSIMQELAENKLINLEEAEIVSHSQPKVGSDSSQNGSQQTKDKSNFGQQSLHSDRVGQLTPSTDEKDIPPQPSNTELKPLPKHLKYAFMGDHQ
ncbi:hypothetical protein CR513_60260, partial [Mucuna pruriens]